MSRFNAANNDWVGRFNVDGLSLLLGAGVAIDDIVVGVPAHELRLLATKDLLELKANLGVNRRAIAQALHHENACAGSILVDLDGDRHDAHATVARLVSILLELSTSNDAITARDSIRHSSIFVDNAQFLCATSMTSIQTLVDKRLDGGVVPKLILGTIRGSRVNLNGLESFEIAPLGDRSDDIARMVELRFQSRRNSPIIGEEALEVLRNWPWPGEETELLNFLDRAQLKFENSILSPQAVTTLLRGSSVSSDFIRPLADVEEEHIYRVLEHHGWNRTRSAKSLGIDVKTLYNKLRRYESKKRMPQKTVVGP